MPRRNQGAWDVGLLQPTSFERRETFSKVRRAGKRKAPGFYLREERTLQRDWFPKNISSTEAGSVSSPGGPGGLCSTARSKARHSPALT